MSEFKRYFTLSLLVFWHTSCATNYHFKTKPEKVEIFVGDKKLGETPIVIDSSQLGEEEAGGYFIRLSKAGYRSMILWLPDISSEINLDLNINPLYIRQDEEASAYDKDMDRKDLNAISEKFLNLQEKLLLTEESDTELVERLKDVNPSLGTAYFLAAVAALKLNDKERAKNYLKEAVRFSPKENDFMILLNEVEK